MKTNYNLFKSCSFFFYILKTYTIFFVHISKRNKTNFRTTLYDLFQQKAILNIELLNKIDFFVRTSQMARLYGIQFLEVLTRGSQFRVESMLFRLAKAKSFFAPSVSPEQRNKLIYFFYKLHNIKIS